MKLADKPVYPCQRLEKVDLPDDVPEVLKHQKVLIDHPGITFREALILSLAGNSSVVIDEKYANSKVFDQEAFAIKTLHEWNAIRTIKTADAIIKRMEDNHE